MSEQAEGQRTPDNKVSRRGLFKLGTAVGVAAAAAKILPDAKQPVQKPQHPYLLLLLSVPLPSLLRSKNCKPKQQNYL